MRSHFGRKLMKINGITQGRTTFIRPDTKRSDAAVGLVDIGQDRLSQSLFIRDYTRRDHLLIKCHSFKQIFESVLKMFQRIRARVQRNDASSKLRYLPQIVDPMAMVGMVMSNDHTIDVSRPGCEQLLAKIRTAIHQQRLAAALDQD